MGILETRPGRRPDRPVTRIGVRKRLGWKPVAQTSTSAGRSTPSAVTTPVAVISAIGSVTSETLSRFSAPSHTPLSSTARLPPGG